MTARKANSARTFLSADKVEAEVQSTVSLFKTPEKGLGATFL